jgi:hypothetical protein
MFDQLVRVVQVKNRLWAMAIRCIFLFLRDVVFFGVGKGQPAFHCSRSPILLCSVV